MPENFEVVHDFGRYDRKELLPQQLQLLVTKAEEAAKNAYAPYSGFHVGAAIADVNDVIFIGNNQENAAYPSGMCAERVALFAASATQVNLEVAAIAVVAYSDNLVVPAPPCGNCRQTILEYEARQSSPIQVIFGWEKGAYIVAHSIEDLLPLNFSRKNLQPNQDPSNS
jgi:cytidine deaminase